MFEVNAETDRWAQIDNDLYPFLQNLPLTVWVVFFYVYPWEQF